MIIEVDAGIETPTKIVDRTMMINKTIFEQGPEGNRRDLTKTSSMKEGSQSRGI